MRAVRSWISWWLGACVVAALSMVVLGGIVRLERAGLSITEWRPLTGAWPPVGADAWAVELEKYRATPEFRAIHAGITLDEFRTIYLLEYGHRLLGRVTGLLLALPLLALLATKRLSVRQAAPLLIMLAVGAIQGLIGWLMVKSGLVDVPHVSPPRLALHLVVGVGVVAALGWMLLDLADGRSRRLPLSAIPILTLTFLTVGWGGLMAGTHAGLVFSSFPKMGGQWLPLSYAEWSDGPATHAAAIHFTHRALALAFAIGGLFYAWRLRGIGTRARALGVAFALLLTLQISLGAWVVIAHVPVIAASLHQAVGALLAVVVCLLARESSLLSVRQAVPTDRVVEFARASKSTLDASES